MLLLITGQHPPLSRLRKAVLRTPKTAGG